MKPLLLLMITCVYSTFTFGECSWSNKLIFDEKAPSIDWRYCVDANGKTKVDVSGIVIQPNANFIFHDPACPECSEIYSTPSPNKNLTVISMRNAEFKSNVWILDIEKKKILYFSDEVHGRHILFKWINDTELAITHGGMGYGTVYYVKPINGKWKIYKTKELKGLL